MKAIIYGCIGLLFLAGCSNGNNTPAAAASAGKEEENSPATETVTLSAEQMQSVGIVVGSPELSNISGTLTLQGSIDVPPQNSISLSFPLGGYLKSTAMLPGTRVKKGQVLAVMEDMQFIQLQQDYLTAKTNFELAESEFSRQRELNSSKASSDKVFQQAKADMERQRILMSALGEKLGLIGINVGRLNTSNISKEVPVISPINGFVSKVNVTIGKYTSPTDVLFELVDPGDIHLALNVFEKDLDKISIGEKALAYTNSYPDKKYRTEVILINRTLDANRMAQVHCHFEKYDPSLVPGMFMNAEVALDNIEALTVPEEAVVRWENRYFVFIENNAGRFKMAEVKPGVTSHDRIQIDGQDITKSTRIAVKNAFALLMKIKNTEEEG